MPKYNVHFTYRSQVVIRGVEAESEIDAIAKSNDEADEQMDDYLTHTAYAVETFEDGKPMPLF